MADFDAAPGAAFALEALEVGALVYVAGRAYRLDRTRRFVRAAEADRLDADACGAGDADGAAAPDGPSLTNVLDLSAWTPLRAPVPPPALPEGGHLAFSPAKKVRFAELLAESGNVRHACAVTGISRHTAYKARRRDGVLAQAWDAALALAAEHVDAVLAERALEGVEEPVFWKGELVGTRRRYDNRLLLAHLARLEAHAAHRPVALAAGRFDELLARLGGQAVDPALLHHRPTFMDGGMRVERQWHVPGLALPRGEWCTHAQRYAEEAAAMMETDDADYDWEEEEWVACTGAASAAAWYEAHTRWDAHREAAWDYVDALEQAWDEPFDAVEREGFEPAMRRAAGLADEPGMEEERGVEEELGGAAGSAVREQPDDPPMEYKSMEGVGASGPGVPAWAGGVWAVRAGSGRRGQGELGQGELGQAGEAGARASGTRRKSAALNCVTPVTPLGDGGVAGGGGQRIARAAGLSGGGPPLRGGSGLYPASPIFRTRRSAMADFDSAVIQFTAQGCGEYDAGPPPRHRGSSAVGAGPAS